MTDFIPKKQQIDFLRSRGYDVARSQGIPGYFNATFRGVSCTNLHTCTELQSWNALLNSMIDFDGGDTQPVEPLETES